MTKYKAIELAVMDRGYRGAKKSIPDEIDILLPSPPLKRDSVINDKRNGLYVAGEPR